MPRGHQGTTRAGPADSHSLCNSLRYVFLLGRFGVPGPPARWVWGHCKKAAAPSRGGRAGEGPQGGVGDSTAWGAGREEGPSPPPPQEGAGAVLRPLRTLSPRPPLVSSPPGLQGQLPSQPGRVGSSAHHQVAPELIVDDGRQQVHQKQAPLERKRPWSVGTPVSGDHTGRGRVWKEHQRWGPRGSTRA